jgi:hypothetical protein
VNQDRDLKPPAPMRPRIVRDDKFGRPWLAWIFVWLGASSILVLLLVKVLATP